MYKKNFYEIIQKNISTPLPFIDNSIEFEYYFDENPNGDFHKQNYCISS